MNAPERDALAAAVAELGALPMPVGTADVALTPDREQEIRNREQAATPGPWEECPTYGADFYAYLGGSYLRGVGSLTFGEGEDADADRAFTLNAREDVPALLAEVDRLRARVAELEAARTTAAADRDAQIIAWLAKKAAEEGTSNKDSRVRATAIYRMADKLSRGAVRPACPPVPEPDPLAYGPTGYRCGCGKDAHSNLTPCRPDPPLEAPAPGALAEQRHLLDPLDHVLEHLADERPTPGVTR